MTAFNKTTKIIGNIIDWFKNLKQNIAEFTADLLSGSYSLITDIVLHTPLLLFDNQWFKENILQFTGLSIAMVLVLSMFEGVKRILSMFTDDRKSTHTDMKRISKRFPITLLISAVAPSAFYYGFKALNGLTNVILDIGKFNMQATLNGLKFDTTSWLDISMFLAFDMALIVMLIPVLLQNFRRWFDLVALGMLTPLAWGCWVFKSLEHYHKEWWQHIKKCSLTQLSYAVFILIIGTLMFGFKTPDTIMGLLVKVGIVIGGLWRMSNPPSIFGRYIEKGANSKDMWKGAKKSITPNDDMKKANSIMGKVGDMTYARFIPKGVKNKVEGFFGGKNL